MTVTAAIDAERLRAEVWSDELPVDPVLIARRLGIEVLNAPLDHDVQGALIKSPGSDPRIVLNEADPPNRRRFTCAHEIGHYYRRRGELDEYEYIDYRDSASSSGTHPEERYANQFAACLLMPKDAVLRFHQEGLSEVEMAVRFGVSREAMHYRLESLQVPA